tara:strand:- start:4235 stop:4417 length:183 start_codon:yes stop_codon:yes gene_type:complete
MKKSLTALLCVMFMVGCLEPPVENQTEEAPHWHQLYVEDNCSRCPDCCVTFSDGGLDAQP